jgi:hypothetical protein
MNLVKLILLITAFFITPLFSQHIEFLNPDKIDVGKVREGEEINGTIKFVNVGNTDVIIKNIRTSCGCTAARPDKQAYAKGDTAVINFAVKTQGFKGNIRKTIRISFENSDIINESFTIQAHIYRDLNVTPDYLQFNQVSQNTDTTITDFFEIQNEADTPIEIKKISVYNDLLKIFPENAVIPAHKSHLFQVKFTPKKAGKFDTRISIESNYQQQPILYLPVFIQINS